MSTQVVDASPSPPLLRTYARQTLTSGEMVQGD